MKGLKVKYNVYKVENNELVKDCFVLRPQKDLAARKALNMYAINTKNKALKQDILKWLKDIRKNYGTLGEIDLSNKKTISFKNYGNSEEQYIKQENEINELERLAEIGRATEKVLEKGFLVHDYFYQLPNIESLLNWYRTQVLRK